MTAVDADILYEIPLVLHDEGLDDYVCKMLHLDEHEADLTEWTTLGQPRAVAAEDDVHIGLVGKYINLPDAYLSVVEALKHGGYSCGANVLIDWIAADDAEGLLADSRLHDLDGIVVPGGFGMRGIPGQDRGGRIRTPERHPLPRSVSRPALRGHRVRSRRVQAREREQLRVRPEHPASGHRPHGRAEGRRRHGRHDAARRLPGEARCPGAWCARSTAKRSCTNGTVIATS